ncbi:MAG: hypothetical protein ACJA1R_000924 [Flavobacteriales bacterium]|jgi:hypothetical protein
MEPTRADIELCAAHQAWARALEGLAVVFVAMALFCATSRMLVIQ